MDWKLARGAVALVSCIFGFGHVALGSDPAVFSPAIQKQLALPEERIDIGIAALTFARELYPGLDIAAYSKRIDLLADKARQLAVDIPDPETRIRILNTVLFLNEGFHYDHVVFARGRQEYYFLNGILDTKQGICYTMPLLYMAVAQRLGYPVYPVTAPDHIFMRYADSSFTEQNIETTSGGKYVPDYIYIRNFLVSKKGLDRGSYMRTLTYREFLGHLLAANALFLARQGQTGKAIAYLEKATELNPRCPDNYDNLRIIYSSLSEVVNPDLAAVYREKAEHYAHKAAELGFVDPTEVEKRQTIRGKS